MAVLRDTEGSVGRARLEQAWAEPVQRERALQSLIADGLVVSRTAATPCPAEGARTSSEVAARPPFG